MRSGFLGIQASGARLEEGFTTGRFAVLLGLVLCVMFHDVLLGVGTFFYRDFGLYGYPLAHYTRESFWQGEFPLWNPLNNCGLPFLAQWNTMTLYPPSLFYLFLPLSWALGVFCILHLFLGGMGMYCLAHRWTGNRLAASVAGLVFAVNGFSMHSLMWPNNIAAFGWMPWVVWGVERAWREGHRRGIIAAGFLGTMQMLAGAPEIILLTWIFLGGLLLVEAWPSETGWRNGWRLAGKLAGKFTGRFALVILIVAGLSAAQLVPFLDLLAHSHRDTGYGGMEWAMPVLGWANFLVPLFQTQAAHHGVPAQYDQYWTSSYYVGVGTVALALWAACRIRERRVWLLAGISALCLVLALGDGGFLLKWLHQVAPQLQFMRFPIKFVTLVIFTTPLLAAYAIGRLRSQETDVRDRQTFVVVTLTLLALMGGIIGWAHLYPMSVEDWPTTWRNAVGRAVMLLCVTGVVLAIPRVARPRWQWACAVSLLMLVWGDVQTHAPRLNPIVPRWVYEPGLARAGSQFDPEPGHGESRAKAAANAQREMHYSSVAKPSDDYLGRRLSLSSNCNLLDGIPEVSGFFSLYLKEANEILDPFRYVREEQTGGLLEFLGVSQITVPGTLMDWMARRPVMPFITGGQKPVYLDAETTMRVVREGRFAPRDVVMLPLDASRVVTATNRTVVNVLAPTVKAHRIEFEAEAEAPSLVTIAQSYYHPWRAYVDDEPVRIWRSNHAFQTLEVPAGRHRVTVVYEDVGFRAGLIVTLLSLLGCGVSWVRGGAARRGGSLVELSKVEAEHVSESVAA